MTRPDPKTIKVMAQIVQAHPEFLAWLGQWRQSELEQLPHAIPSPALYQGRCQVLGELYRFASDAPSLAAKL